jgi:thioredoxin-dependent peroxiredoxin
MPMWTMVLAAAGVILLFIMSTHLGSPRVLRMVGCDAHDFSLRCQDGTLVRLTDFRGRWVILYFYPKDSTPGCTAEAREFQQDQAEYEKRNAVVLGVSTDDEGSHCKFSAKEGLHFRLLADTAGQVSGTSGSLRNFGFTKISARNTFLIDPKGRIARTFAGVNPFRHSAEVLAALDELEKPQLQPLR